MKDANSMIADLSPEIDRKCAELRQARADRMYFRLFISLCVLALLIPLLFVILGISFKFLILPIVVTTVTFLLLSPIILTNREEKQNEKV